MKDIANFARIAVVSGHDPETSRQSFKVWAQVLKIITFEQELHMKRSRSLT